MPRIETQEATIADGETESGAVGLGDAGILGLDIPTIDAAALAFHASLTIDGDYRPVSILDLTAMAVSNGTGNCFIGAEALSPLRGCEFVKIIADAAQSPAVTLTFVLKRYGR